jgi:hypothetical protein
MFLKLEEKSAKVANEAMIAIILLNEQIASNFFFKFLAAEKELPESQKPVCKSLDRSCSSKVQVESSSARNQPGSNPAPPLISPSIKQFASAAAFKDVTNIQDVSRDLSFNHDVTAPALTKEKGTEEAVKLKQGTDSGKEEKCDSSSGDKRRGSIIESLGTYRYVLSRIRPFSHPGSGSKLFSSWILDPT